MRGELLGCIRLIINLLHFDSSHFEPCLFSLLEPVFLSSLPKREVTRFIDEEILVFLVIVLEHGCLLLTISG